MRTILTLGVLIATLIACREQAPPPSWLNALQSRIASEPLTNPPSQILRFRVGERTVYYRPPYCCDVQSVLYSDTGEIVCHPSGGITGRGDGRCPNFYAQRSDCETVWTDPRASDKHSDGCAQENHGAPATR